MSHEYDDRGTQVMSPEDVKRERQMQDDLARLADIKRIEETKRVWHVLAMFGPLVAAFLVICFLGTVGLLAFKMMADLWGATDWVW